MVTIEKSTAGVMIPVRVRAGARRNGIAGEHDGALRIDVTAAPEKGKANREVIAILARALGLPKSTVEIVSGATSPQKRLSAAGLDLAEAQRRLAAALRERS
jgi:uncharacterized protein (TIGR00251 family)